MSVRYRVSFGKSDVAEEGPDDAEATVTIEAKHAGTDPTVAFMQGRLKTEGSTGAVFEALWSGEAAAVISRLASRP